VRELVEMESETPISWELDSQMRLVTRVRSELQMSPQSMAMAVLTTARKKLAGPASEKAPQVASKILAETKS
jgi:hypothetical protein